ncbi:hypothetical protein [Moraxella phage Mcat28]|nr:hypothetical protein [Moraxella phage Mcat28]
MLFWDYGNIQTNTFVVNGALKRSQTSKTAGGLAQMTYTQ